jgi:hypothetical protein
MAQVLVELSKRRRMLEKSILYLMTWKTLCSWSCLRHGSD